MLTSLLLNWRLWAVLGLLAANAVSYSTGHHKGYLTGRAEVQDEFTAYKEQSFEQAMAEQVKRNAEAARMSETNQKVTENYETLKTATSTAVRALDSDRMRLQAAIASRRSSATSDTKAGLSPDAGPEVRVLGECIRRYEEVAGDAQSLSDTVKSLQDYVAGVVTP
jgi:hypothetical protein